jgi:hypothetical protein
MNEDTSDFSINVEQIPNAKKFCLRQAYLPLSTYTFEEGDVDSKLSMVNLGTQPNGQFLLPGGGAAPLFANGFVVPNGSDYDPAQTFPNGDPDSSLTFTRSWIQIPPLTKFMIRSPLFFGDTEIKYFYDVPNCDNTSNSDYLNVTMFTFIQGMNEALQWVCAANMGPGNKYECQIGLSNYPTFLQINDYDKFNNGGNLSLPFFFSVFEHSNLDNMSFKAFEFGTSTDPNPRPPVQHVPAPMTPIGPGPWYIPPIGWTVIELFHNMYNTPTGTRQTVSCTQLQNTPLFAHETVILTLPGGTVYTPSTILAGLNPVAVPYGLTLNLQPTGGVPVLGLTNTSARFYADLTVFPNLKLGITDILQTKSVEVFLSAQLPITLIRPGDIQFFSASIDIAGLGSEENLVRDTFNTVLGKYDITMYTGVQYSNSNVLNIPGPVPSSVVNTWDVPNRGVYGFTLNTDQHYNMAGVRLDTTAMDVSVGNPASYWTSKNARFVHYTGTNGYMMQQDYYFRTMPKYPLWNYQFPVDVLLTTGDVQALLTSITTDHPGLTITLDVTKNTILFNNNTADFFQFYPNHKMGIYDSTTADEAVIVGGGTTTETTHPVDLSGRNAVLSIGLSFYHDGRTAQSYGRPVHKGIPRPIRRNIVATVYNATQTNYGQYIHYSNPSDVWLPCYYNNIQDIRIQIYNDQLLPINLHMKDVHLEIDILAEPV